MNNWKLNFRKWHLQYLPQNVILMYKSNKNVQNPFAENHKTLMKEVKDYLINGETAFMGWNPCSWMPMLPQVGLWV